MKNLAIRTVYCGLRTALKILPVRCTKRGFTLIELLMSASIGIFVLGAVASLLLGGIAGLKTAGEFHQVYQEARMAMQWIDRDVKESHDIPTLKTIGGTAYTADKDTLILQRSSGDDGNYDYVVYNLVTDGTDYLGNTLYRLDRIFFDNYTSVGIAQTGSSSSTRTVARNVAAPTGSGYLFSATTAKVSVDLTASRIRTRAKEQVIQWIPGTGGGATGSGLTATSSLRLVSEIKKRN